MSDDFFHLRFIATHSVARILFDPGAWKDAPFRMFTPGLSLSLVSDRAAGGLDPRLFYDHQLAVLAIAGVVLFFALRARMSRSSAAAAALLTLLGLPVCRTVAFLSARHYFDGLAFGAIALLLQLRLRRRAGSILSAVAYFAAMSAKEIYVPLVVVFAVLEDEPPRLRLRRLFPHAVALAVYLAWRWTMLGTLGGGYGFATPPENRPSVLARLPGAILRSLTEDRSPAIAAVALMALAVAAWIVASRRVLPAVAVTLAAILPIVPVAAAVAPRYGLFAWIGLAAAYGASIDAFLPRRAVVQTALLLAPVALLAPANRSVWRDEIAFDRRMSAEALAYGRLGPNDALAHPALPPPAMGELAWVETHLFGRAAKGTWFFDDLYLCGPGAQRRAWAYDAASGSVLPASEPSPDRRRAACAPTRNAAPLRAEFRVRGPDLFWSFGPYASGYRIVLDDGMSAFDVPAEAGYQVGDLPAARMRVEYRSPGGGAAISPELTIPLGHDAVYRWSRPARRGPA